MFFQFWLINLKQIFNVQQQASLLGFVLTGSLFAK